MLPVGEAWQSQGKRNEACDLLASVYNWFTEGVDTKDLNEAKSLLEEVAQWLSGIDERRKASADKIPKDVIPAKAGIHWAYAR